MAGGETVTNWSATGLPPGMVISPSSGLISGNPALPGVYKVRLKAIGSWGSATLDIVMGVESTAISNSAAIEITIDVATKEVAAGPKKQDSGVVFNCKSGDVVALSVRFVKGANPVSLDVSKLAIWIKEIEPDAVILSSATWVKVGSGAGASYLLSLPVSSASLQDALSNHESNTVTGFAALAEIEWIESRVWAPSAPAQLMRQTSSTFKVGIERSLAGVS